MFDNNTRFDDDYGASIINVFHRFTVYIRTYLIVLSIIKPIS